MRRFRLAATFVSMILAVTLSNHGQFIISLLLVVSIGILHGANDLKLLQQVIVTKSTKQHWIVRIIYSAIVINALGILILYPSFALFFFLILSAYHFGEQHLNEKIVGCSRWAYAAYFCCGITFIALLLLFNMDDVQSNAFKAVAFHLKREYLIAVALFFGLAFLLLLRFFSKQQKDANLLVGELVNIGLLGFVFYYATLPWAFATYFVFWHSVPAFRDQLLELYGKVDGPCLLRYCKNSWLNWLVIVFCFGLFYYVSGSRPSDYTAILVPFITAVTLPHIIVSHLLQRKANRPYHFKTLDLGN